MLELRWGFLKKLICNRVTTESEIPFAQQSGNELGRQWVGSLQDSVFIFRLIHALPMLSLPGKLSPQFGVIEIYKAFIE
jgi:hypothetical protein